MPEPRYINFAWAVQGVPTDVTSVVASDAGATYGVVRADTNASVVAAGTAFTRVTIGSYQLLLPDPAGDIDYVGLSVSIAYTPVGGTVQYIAKTFPAKLTPPPSGSVGQSIGSLITRDPTGTPVGNVSLTFQLVDAGSGTDSFDTRPFTLISNVSGSLSGSFVQGATYTGSTRRGDKTRFDVPNASSFPLPEILGEYV